MLKTLKAYRKKANTQFSIVQNFVSELRTAKESAEDLNEQIQEEIRELKAVSTDCVSTVKSVDAILQNA